MRLLLGNGADVHLTQRVLDTALAGLISKGCSTEICEELLVKGADPEAMCPLGKRPIHRAAAAGQLGLLHMLISHNVSPWSKDSYGRPALLYAVSRGSFSIVDDLLAREGVNVGEQDARGHSPLMIAILSAYMGKEFGISKLLEKCSVKDINLQDSEGKTALMHALLCREFDTARRLLEKGADPQIMDCRGRSALYWAARAAPNQVLGLIVDGFEDRDYEPDLFEVAIHGAVASNDRRSMGILLDKTEDDVDVNPNRALSDGWTPLHTAKRYGHSGIESALRFIRDRVSIFRVNGTPLRSPSAWHAHDRVPCLALEPDATHITTRCM